MCTRAECERHIGKWVQLRTPYGVHRGVIERVTATKAIIKSPKQYIPVDLALDDADERKLDVALAWGGYGRGGYPGGGYGGAYGYGAWGRWAVSFLIIYVLWGLWFW
ncbi:hypothetical protein [Alicyclobacillus sp. SO9]|uniref:hypothetical protein n=1 Tax=Alicyclobacillus sp. SO9 TaxID=2665646 RepID=UPI0018E8BAB7|nr:hypothetical protein [Alicyclobacillus sp. SO9]QQE77180.1 hypothetical protein GI364_14520 [Alicyclobacillus sp. SO9]